MEKRISEDTSILGLVSVNFLELSQKVFSIYEKEKEIERQKSIFHLGLISHAFSGIKHTRYEYLIIQCVISELAENSFKGTPSAQGELTINGKKYLGNDIIKTWFLLSNFGHCKNTIGDEKALLLWSLNRRGFKSHLLNTIKDEELKSWAETVFENFDYVNFHHILSFRRIYKTLKRRLELQKEILNVYKLLLLEDVSSSLDVNELKVEQLRMIYRNVRNLTILSLDSRNSSLPINIDILSTVLSFDFYENRFQETKVSDLFNPNLSMLYNHLYLAPQSQTYQRSYEINALEYCRANDFSNILDESITNGLADPSNCTLKHFLRTRLKFENLASKSLSKNLRTALTVKRKSENVEASLDFQPYENVQVMDFYIKQNEFKLNDLPQFLTNITSILDQHINETIRNSVDEKLPYFQSIDKELRKFDVQESTINDSFKPALNILNNSVFKLIQTENVPLFKEILWSVLRLFIKEEYNYDIDHHLSDEYKFFGVRLEDQMDFLTSDIETAIKNTSDEDRIHELNQLLKSVKRKYEGNLIACIQRITIYDYSKAPSKRIITDIDSLLLKYNSNEMILEFHESKNMRNGENEAKKDLQKKFTRALSHNAKGYNIRRVKNYGAKLVIKHYAQRGI